MVDARDAMGDFEETLSRTRAELGRLREARQPDVPQPRAAEGVALDGLIRAEMAIDGRLTGLTLDPSVQRIDVQMLAREIVTAVNTAWAARQGADAAAAATAALDPAALQERLAEVQDRGIASMQRFTQGMQAVIDRLEARVPR